MEHFHNGLWTVITAYTLQGLWLHSLRITADSGYTAVHHSLQFGRRHTVWPPGLHRKLHRILTAETLINQLQHFPEIHIRQAGRGTSTYIDGLHLETIISHYVHNPLQILTEGCHKLVYAPSIRQNICWKRAIQTASQTKWNTYINANGFFIGSSQKRLLTNGHIHNGSSLFLTSLIILPKTSHYLITA